MRRLSDSKGGDPFVFGRGGEEALTLAEAGIEFEVVPGVTAAIAAPAYAGIPVTHRGYASSVAFVTGHSAALAPDSKIHWDKLATAVDTLIVYMGVRHLRQITERLIAHGREPETPVSLIRLGTTPQQVVVQGRTLRHRPEGRDRQSEKSGGDCCRRGQHTSPTAVLV